jgi:hypothetical protein
MPVAVCSLVPLLASSPPYAVGGEDMRLAAGAGALALLGDDTAAERRLAAGLLSWPVASRAGALCGACGCLALSLRAAVPC